MTGMFNLISAIAGNDPEYSSHRRASFFVFILFITSIFVWRNYLPIEGVLDQFSSVQAHLGVDSGRFTDGATAILNGEGLHGRQYSYMAYIFIIALLEYVGLSFHWMIAVQSAFTIGAAFALYFLGKELGGRLAGLLAAALLVENPDLAIWNAYILTDALYTSCAAITIYFVYMAFKRKGVWLPLATFAMILSALIRPSGWILFPAVGLFLFFKRWTTLKARLTGVSAVCFVFIVLALFVPAFSKGIEGIEPVKMLTQGTIIWGYDDWRMEMPQEPGLEDENWVGGLRYIYKHPVASISLALTHVSVELARVRPYYTVRMNIRLAIMVGVLYFFAAIGMFVNAKHPLSHLLLAVIAGNILIIAIAYATYNARLLLHFLPFVMVFTAAGMSYSISRLLGVSPPRFGSPANR